MSMMNAYYNSKPPKVKILAMPPQYSNEITYLLRDGYEEVATEDVPEWEYCGPRESDTLWHVQELEWHDPRPIEEIYAAFDEVWPLALKQSEPDIKRIEDLEEKLNAVMEILGEVM